MQFDRFSHQIAEVIEGQAGGDALLAAVMALFDCEAGFAVLNRPDGAPLYLADSYPDPASKSAVQLYVQKTYLLNPVHGAIQAGVSSGVYRMADLAPDNWSATTADVIADDAEEIHYRTPGWPQGLQEVCVLVALEGGVVGEVSLARTATVDGIPEEDMTDLKAALPLIHLAFQRLSQNRSARQVNSNSALENFGQSVLTSREAEVVQMILKGHSSLSISHALTIALPTVKTHRRNAYAKLGISTQQQLFRLFLEGE